VEALAHHALARFGERLGTHATLSAAAVETLRGRSWPGNVRELMNVLERAVLLSQDGAIDRIEAPAAAEASDGGGGVLALSDAVARAERAAIQAALDRTGDNKAQAAKLLGVSVRTLFYKLDKLGLK
jgi:two-component system response regulator PilR (NtrC family)